MHLTDLRRTGGLLLLAAALLVAAGGAASAGIPGITGTAFNLTAKADRITTPEGGSYLFWGLADGGGRAQYPAPTLILTSDPTASITVTLTNAKHVRLSLQRTSAANLLVRLEDDGQGLAGPVDLASLSAQKHYGLVGISERVALAGWINEF